ncbi:MAG: NUDIX domain-containing protein [Patescibacteria group bacterium]|jgi:8-oxo-dGTP pyrophosphatase MutT (NUDIX family)
MKAKNKFPRGVEVVGAPIIENNKGQLLFIKSPKWGNKWVFPGGHIKAGETIEQGLIREGYEETGLKLKPIKVFNWGELIESKEFSRPAHLIYFDLYCKMAGGSLAFDKREVTDYKWLYPKTALKLNLEKTNISSLKAFLKYKKVSRHKK